MTEKLLNKIRQICCWWLWRGKSFVWRCWSWKKNDDEILSHDNDDYEEDDKTRQIWKLYVLHVMIETTTDPKIICSAVHLSKICTKKDRNILLQKENQRKRCQWNSSKYIPPKYICKLVSNSYKKTNRGESWLYISKL